jgi:bifunctional N-acetylglucosamine-1-phosphate-uridyltransferase/glucosamine-1-phosphate-acetyltransferase GlmU-like protein
MIRIRGNKMEEINETVDCVRVSEGATVTINSDVKDYVRVNNDSEVIVKGNIGGNLRVKNNSKATVSDVKGNVRVYAYSSLRLGGRIHENIKTDSGSEVIEI